MAQTSFGQKLKQNAKLLIAGLVVMAMGAMVPVFVFVAPHLGWMMKESGHHEAEHDAGHAEKPDAHSKKTKGHGETHGHEAPHDAHDSELSFAALVQGYKDAWVSLSKKAENLRRLEWENEQLKLENAHLRLRVEGLGLDCREKAAAKKNQEHGRKLAQYFGNKSARTPESIQYRVPTHLLPIQLYTLGTTYFSAREDEKAAAILTFLTGLKENDQFKTSQHFVMTGIAWYRLGNLTLAEKYFDQAIKAPSDGEGSGLEARRYQAQARLWRGIVANRLGKHTKSQYWLRELVDHHPQSPETAWVNHDGTRKPASEKPKSQPHSKPHEAHHD